MRLTGAKRFGNAILVLVAGCLLVGLDVRAGEPVRLALMVSRPDNRLGWSSHDDATAFMLGCDALLRRAIADEPMIREVGAYQINGIVRAMNEGLYFPTGDTLYEKWRPFYDADVFIEPTIEGGRLQWRAGGASGEVAESEVIADYMRRPMAAAAALVELVFVVSGQALSPDALEGDEWREPRTAALFFEWAKWIGYQPHWAHHAPWRAPQQSAMRILREDPAFLPGVAWALDMIMRDGNRFAHRMGDQPPVASALQLPQALGLLGTPYAEAAYPFLRQFLVSSGLLPQALTLFDLALLDAELMMAAPPQGRDDPVNFAAIKEKKTGPAVRRQLAEVVGRMDNAHVREALVMLLEQDPDAGVRATAARELALHHPDEKDALRQAFDADTAPFPIRTAIREAMASQRSEDALEEAAVAPAARPDALEAQVQQIRGAAQAAAKDWSAWSELAQLLEGTARANRSAVLAILYEAFAHDRAGRARAMLYDSSLIVNLAGLRLAERTGDPAFLQDMLQHSVDTHPNAYVRAEALRVMERRGVAGLQVRCLAGIRSPFWVVRIEAADILSRTATAADAAALQAALADTQDVWLQMALEDALAQARNQPRPTRVPLGLGSRTHTEGGNVPAGFQVWQGGLPPDPAERRRMVDAGYRFGSTTAPPNFPGGTGLNSYNRSDGLRNLTLIELVLGEIASRKDTLPYLYYLALFDEPCNPGSSGAEGMRAMLLEAGRLDLLAVLQQEGADGLPGEWRRAFEWYDARLAAEGSNWVVHMFRLTAQRKYQDLQIFPQSISYMGTQMKDAFDMIDADGDYTWQYHHHNFFRDGSIGAVNRVLHPGKPLNAITWMGWHQINVLTGNTLTLETDYPKTPWRMRNYMGTKSALALWATGTEPGFFTGVGFSKVNDAGGPVFSPGATGGVFGLKPWSALAREAVDFMLDDPRYWRGREGRLAIEIEKPGMEDLSMDRDLMGGLFGNGVDIDSLLDDEPSPLEKALAAEREALFDKLMRGIGYMNLFNTDTTRALSNLPKPDTSRRDSLIILGRDTPYNEDGEFFPIPAIALLSGFDMLPTYDGVGAADLLAYDTILLRASRDGVTSELVRLLNRWLKEKEGGLLIVSGNVSSEKVLFAELRMDAVDEPLLWEAGVEVVVPASIEETYNDRRGQPQTRRVQPRLASFTDRDGASQADPATRIRATYGGAVDPLVTTADGQVLLARWQAPASVRSVVLFDGAESAGPVYTEALESIVLALDRERGSAVVRNPWWGHVVYENEQFVVDVAPRMLRSLLEARPRQHAGVDVITGVINPEVRHDECALILKDYVGPYAGGKANWAVLARRALKAMTVDGPDRLRVEAEGVTRVTRIGPEPIRLADSEGLLQVENQLDVWKHKYEGQDAFSVNAVEGGWELHIHSQRPFTVLAQP